MDPRDLKQNHAAIFQKHYNPRVVSFLVAVLNYPGKYILRKGLFKFTVSGGKEETAGACVHSQEANNECCCCSVSPVYPVQDSQWGALPPTVTCLPTSAIKPPRGSSTSPVHLRFSQIDSTDQHTRCPLKHTHAYNLSTWEVEAGGSRPAHVT